MTLPFQGAEVLLDSVMPLSGNRWGLWLGGTGVERRSFSLRVLVHTWRSHANTDHFLFRFLTE